MSPEILAPNESISRQRIRNTADARLLAAVADWQSKLARHLAFGNPGRTSPELHRAVCWLLVQITFLRLAEVRGLEPACPLQDLLQGAGTFDALTEISGILAEKFHVPAGEHLLGLHLDDDILREVLHGLYAPDLAAQVSCLSDDILGRVYEQILAAESKVTGGAAGVDSAAQRPGGAYYTPAAVVDYIVKQTVGKLLVGQSPQQAGSLTILDPACGGGAFLIGAYRFLLAWHEQWYLAAGPRKHRQQMQQTSTGEWRLTPAERMRILRCNLYGVDIDPQAVEVTKLSLLLTAISSDEQDNLPNLAGNIKCGDSLIGADYFKKTKTRPADESDQRPVQMFEWRREFPAIIQAGGFDAVIGNPPYLNIRLITARLGPVIKEYLKSKFRCACGNFDLYVLFVEQGLRLLRGDGRWGMIVPNKIGGLDYARQCRRMLLAQTTMDEIVDLSACRVFEGASVYPYILVWQKTVAKPGHEIIIGKAAALEALEFGQLKTVLRQSSLNAINGFALHDVLDVESRVPTAPLDKQACLHSGTTGFAAQEMAGLLSEFAKLRPGECAFDFIVTGNIDRYRVDLGEVRFMKQRFERPVLAVRHPFLSTEKRRLFANPKLVIAGMARRLEVAADPGGLALGVQVFAASQLADDPRYLLALLNSKLMTFLFRARFPSKRLAAGYLAINQSQLGALPVRTIQAADLPAVALRNQIVALADGMLQLHGKLSAVEDAEKNKSLRDQIAATDHEVDSCVYQLYQLTDSEIERVEKSECIAD